MVPGAARETRHTALSTFLDDLDQSLQTGDLGDLEPVPTGFPAID